MRAARPIQLLMSISSLAVTGCAVLGGLQDTGPCQPEFHGGAPGAVDRYVFVTEDGFRGYRTGFGSVVIDPRFTTAYEFSLEGLAAAIDPVEGPIFIDVNGRVVAHAYALGDGPDFFQEGRARIVGDGMIGFIDRVGNVVVEPRFDQAAPFCNGVAEVCVGCQDSGGDRFRIDDHGARLRAE